ncbi:MAG: HEAT repeat domain-containing protein [Phycisphaeraceae bacterium JB051]
MNLRMFSAIIIVLTVVFTGINANAQQLKLDSALISTTQTLDGAQQLKLDEYANFWIQKMLTSQDPEVSAARDQLVSPLRHPSATEVFKAAYSATLIGKIPEKLIQSQRMIVRFNAMLCLADLSDKSAIPIVQAGLADNNPAIRYLAAQAAGKLGAKLDNTSQVMVLTLLQNVFFNEPDQVVIEQILGSMSQLTIPQARSTMLFALNEHVNVHHGNPTITLKADYDAMRILFKNIVTEQAGGQEIPLQVSKQFARAAFRFMLHCSRALDQGRVHQSLQNQYTSMIQLSENILRWISTRAMQVPENSLPQNDMAPNIRTGAWTTLHLRSQEWGAMLQGAPFNISQRDLAVPTAR